MNRFSRLTLMIILMLTAALASTAPAQAAPGDILRTINVTPAPPCSVTVGIAFDGSELMVSCWDSDEIVRVDPADGTNLGAYIISGMTPGDGIGALSWDAANNLLWLGTALVYPQKVYSVVLNSGAGTGVATYRFSHTGGGFSIIDGLAYDGTDDTIWLSPDVDGSVFHYSLTGTLLGTFSVSGMLGGCGNSGLVVADATTLYLANNGCEAIYIGQKDGSSITLFATLAGKRVEDLECDNTTFAPKSVIWSKDAYDYELNAFEVTAGQCAEGGVVDPVEGRMTGGGSVFTSSGARVTHGFELHCQASDDPNRLQINWGQGNRFHLESLTSANCSDDASIAPEPPAAGFDTYQGAGNGRCNGVAGHTATWTFTDAGEPGRNDTASITISGPSCNLTVSGSLRNGNHQAHAH